MFDRTESWRNAISTRPDLVQLRLELEKLGIVVRYRFNQIFPRFDLVGGYGLQGWANSSGDTFGDILNQSNPVCSYDVQFSIPLAGNRAARNGDQADRAPT